MVKFLLDSLSISCTLDLLFARFIWAVRGGISKFGSTAPSRRLKSMSPCSLTAKLVLYKLLFKAWTIIDKFYSMTFFKFSFSKSVLKVN